MQHDNDSSKMNRLLDMYDRLNRSEMLNKSKLADEFNVSEKTIQRDIHELREYLENKHLRIGEPTIQYDRTQDGYCLVQMEREWLTNKEVLALCKILLESRAFEPEELNGLIQKLLLQVAPNDRDIVQNIIKNEQFHYVPLQHKKKLLAVIWTLSQLIAGKEITEIEYTRLDGTVRTHQIKPVAIMFSEFYFYIVGFIADDSKKDPTVFRIDRIGEIRGTGEKYKIPYTNRFEDGEFRKRIQFMTGGELRRVTFEYSGASLEAVLDRLPTAKVLKEVNGVYTIAAEVYGDGIDMWLKGQGDAIQQLKVKA